VSGILDWGVDVVLWFQQFSPALDLPFKAFTFLGEEGFFLLFLSFVYWCADRGTGARLTILFLVSAAANALAKQLAGQPRPFEIDSRVQKLYDAGGGGLPSGHTQHAVIVWGYLASQWRRRGFWALAGLLMVLIPLSRVYLGVHFPTDLLGGYVLGAALLAGFLWLAPWAEATLVAAGLFWQLAAVALGCALLTLAFPVAGATLLGMGLGFALERRWVGFETQGTVAQRGLRYLLAVPALFALRWALHAAFDGLEPAAAFGFIRYCVLGVAGALGAPWVFVKLGLAARG